MPAGTEVSRPAVVVNPTKVRRTVQDRVGSIDERRWLATTPGDPGTGMAAAALATGADLVLSYGGDGTHRACAAALAGTGVPLALLPAGTGNLLARRLRVPRSLDGAQDLAMCGGRRAIDVCDADGQPFLVMAGLGFDAAVLARTRPGLKSRVGWVAYWLAALQSVGRSPVLRVRLELDGGRQVTCRGVGVVVANIGTLPGGFPLLPQAAEDDGLLTVGLLTSDSLAHWAVLGGGSAARRTPSPERLPCWSTRQLRVSVDRPVPAQIDGEVVPARRDVEFSVRARALTVCVPEH